MQASARLFMERGYAGSGLKQIAEAGTATIGSLYHFFPGGKTELAAETLRVSGAAYQALVEAVFDAEPDLVRGVEACFEGAAEALQASGYADACPIATVALEVASSDEQLRVVTAEIFARWHDAVRRRLAAGGVDARQVDELATTLVAALEGGFLLSRAARDGTPMRRIGVVMAAAVAAAIPS